MKQVVPQPTGMLAEFMKFVTKTNAIALAIGVIIGGAATKLLMVVLKTDGNSCPLPAHCWAFYP